MNYVVACITFFNAGEKEVVVKARGRTISSAVDTVELLKRAFVKDLEIKSIEIGTEEMVRPEGQKANARQLVEKFFKALVNRNLNFMLGCTSLRSFAFREESRKDWKRVPSTFD